MHNQNYHHIVGFSQGKKMISL